MKYRGILLDLDNTLYNYESAHRPAMEAVSSLAVSLGIDGFDFHFKKARESVHRELAESASSHNRLLYFQRSLESAGFSAPEHALDFYNAYWDTFLEHAVLYEGVAEFLKRASQKVKVCLVTDLTAHIQYRKIRKFGIAEYIHYIVSSEEAGREKPHPWIFVLALRKLGLANDAVCMIGDSYKKDIAGAEAAGIQGYYFCNAGRCDEEKHSAQRIFTDFRMLAALLEL